jgi:hypothetical protein
MPFKVPALCDACANRHNGESWDAAAYTCNAFTEGVPLIIREMGGHHFNSEGQEEDIVFEMREDGEDDLAAWLGFWHTIDDGTDMEDGVKGILPRELDTTDT